MKHVQNKLSHTSQPGARNSDAFTRRTDRLNQKNKQKRQKTFIRIGVLLVSVTIVAWFIAFSRVSGVKISDSSARVSPDTYQELISRTDEYFQRTTSWRAGLDLQNFENYLTVYFPEFKDVSANLPINSRSVVISVEDFTPAIIWQASGRQYYVSPSGVIMRLVEASENIQGYPIVFDEAGLALGSGDRIVSPEFVQFIQDSERAIESVGLQQEAYKISSSTRVVRVEIEGGNYQVLTSVDIEPLGQWESVVDLLDTLRDENRPKPSEYIDTRVAGRIYWQ